MKQTETQTPKGTTHIKMGDNNERIRYYKLTPVNFNDGTTGTRIEYFNYDWESWQGCVNTYNEVLNLITNKDKSIIEL